MKPLQTAIYNKTMSTATTLRTTLSSRFYFSIAPQDTTFPYVTYDFVTSNYENQFTEDFEVVYVQFNIFSQNTSSSEAGDIYATLIALYDWCTLTISGYSLVEMRRTFTTTDYFADDTVWMYTTEYRVWIRKT
jgi:hypothetical protein